MSELFDPRQHMNVEPPSQLKAAARRHTAPGCIWILREWDDPSRKIQRFEEVWRLREHHMLIEGCVVIEDEWDSYREVIGKATYNPFALDKVDLDTPGFAIVIEDEWDYMKLHCAICGSPDCEHIHPVPGCVRITEERDGIEE